MKLTEAQSQAVDHLDGKLIVSAAAGAGKTAVLTLRVAQLLCDEQNPLEPDRLLIVTFTNAAAAEMRARIAKELSDRLAKDPGNSHIRRQIAMLGRAKIQTVHAFCRDLLRRNFSKCRLSPDFVLLSDETRTKMLISEALEDMLENEYRQGGRQLLALQEAVSEQRGDRALEKMILSVYEKTLSHPNPDRWLNWAAQAATATPDHSAWGKMILQHAEHQCDFGLHLLERAENLLEHDAILEKNYKKSIDYCKDFAIELKQAISQGWDSAVLHLKSFAIPTAGRSSGADEGLKDQLQKLRGRFKEDMDKLAQSYLRDDSTAIEHHLAEVSPHVAELCRLVGQFREQYSQLKRRRDLVDFSDLEHLTLSLLRDEHGDPTALATELSESICYLMVDEYQDTNAVQELIFSLISPGDNSAFYVGDVKQSIYRFRLADPSIFLDKWQSGLSGDNSISALALNQNFRSREPVLKLCNFILERTMSMGFGGMEYDDSQKLVPGRTGGDTAPPCEMWLINSKNAQGKKAEIEAQFVAKRISDLLSDMSIDGEDGTRRLRPDDCAILLSSLRSRAPYYVKALSALGIPCSYGDEGDFFTGIEMTSVLSLLRTIDNRLDDIPLIATLTSPLFMLTHTHIAQMRMLCRDGYFIECVELAAEAGDERAEHVLAELNDFSDRAADLGCAGLLRYIYDKTGAESIFSAMDNGAIRGEKLRRLYSLSLSLDGGNAQLCDFISYIDAKIASGSSVSMPTRRGGVSIMSIHKSKGLEFPLVIVPDLAKGFNTDDLKSPSLFHIDHGIGLCRRDSERRLEYRTPPQHAIELAMRREMGEEELRKLYTAMTRARDKLIMTAISSRMDGIAEEFDQNAGTPFGAQWMARQSNALSWVLSALCRHAAWGDRNESADSPKHSEDLLLRLITPEQFEQASMQKHGQGVAPEYAGKQREALALSEQNYRHIAASQLPSKVTPSGVESLIYGHHAIDFESFIKGGGAQAAAHGTAIHEALARADLKLCATEIGAQAELSRLCEGGFIDRADIQPGDGAAIAQFCGSELGKLAADNCLREYRFSALLPSELLSPDFPQGERFLINGAIDLLIEQGDKCIIVDFKSDAVRPGHEERAAERHKPQLDIYAHAVGEIFGCTQVDKIIWFLKTATAVVL